MSASDAVLEGRLAWRIVFASLGLGILGYGSELTLIVSLKTIALEFGWPREVPSAAYAGMLIGIGSGGVVMGWWSDKRGMAGPALLGAVSIGSGVMLASQATAPWHFYLAYGLLVGFLGNATVFTPLVANATRWFYRRRGLAVAIVASGQSIGGALLAPLFRYATESFGWRAMLLGYGAFALALMPPLALVVRRPPPAASATPGRFAAGPPGRARDPAGGRILATLFVAQLCCCVAMAAPLVHVVAHVSDLGHPMARAAEVLSVILATSFVSRFGLGWLSDRIGGLNALLTGSSMQAVALLLFAIVEDLSALYAVGVFFGLGFGGIVPSYAITVRELFPERGAARRIATVFMGGTIGMASGGWLAGRLFDHFGTYSYAFLVALAVNLLNLAIVVTLILWKRRGGASVLATGDGAAP